MRELLTTASAVVVLLNGLAFAQEVPPLIQGEKYSVARARLIKTGWQKDGADGSSDCSFYPSMCKKFSEFASASADGYCKFIWRNIDGHLLGITTYPCFAFKGQPGPVTGWRWEKP